MSATGVARPPQVGTLCTGRPVCGGQLLRGLMFGLPVSVLLWLLLGALVMAII